MKFAKYSRNTQGKDYVVGDIHGEFSKLKHVLDYDVGFDYKKDRLFTTGDVVDRGFESELCFKWIGQSWFHSVLGNHEQMLIDAYECPDSHAIALSKYNGGEWFWKLDDLTQQCYIELFKTLPRAIQVGAYGIVHSYVPEDDWNVFSDENVSLTEEQAQCSIWDRRYYNSAQIIGWDSVAIKIRNIKHVYVGHTSIKKGETFTPPNSNQTFMDTGAVFGGYMVVKEIGEL